MDGTPLHASYWPAAQPAAGLLVVHGMQSHAGWFEAAGSCAELAARGVAVLAYDRRGSGRSGGERGDAPGAAAFLADLDAAREALAAELARSGASGAPLHALANCFGTRILLPYAAEHPRAFRSLALTAPATAMSRAADYSAGEKLAILAAAPARRFATPLVDSLFVSSGPFLDWIRADPLSLRAVTARFLRATAVLTRRMRRAARALETPLLVVLGSRDAMVDNAAIRRRFVGRWRGPVRLVELDAEHYVDFTDRRPELARAIGDWVLERSIDGAG